MLKEVASHVQIQKTDAIHSIDMVHFFLEVEITKTNEPLRTPRKVYRTHWTKLTAYFSDLTQSLFGSFQKIIYSVSTTTA